MIEIETENRMEENNRLLAAKGNKVRGNRDAGWRTAPVKIIAGNKCDLKEARVVSSKMGLDWAKSKDCGFMETSARDMVNIEETFACEWTVQLSLLSLIHPGMVRKVVEARRQANGIGAGPAYAPHHGTKYSGGPGYSQPLQMNSRRQPSPTPMSGNEKSRFDDEPRKPWWKRWLTCSCMR